MDKVEKFKELLEKLIYTVEENKYAVKSILELEKELIKMYTEALDEIPNR